MHKTSIHCPHCGAKRRDVSRSIEECVSCEKPLPSCPGCGSLDVGFIGINLFGCYGCRTEFHPPGLLRNKGTTADSSDWMGYWAQLDENKFLAKLTKEDFEFLRLTAKRLKGDITRIPTYDSGGRLTKLGYLHSLKYCIRIEPLLKIRREFSEGKTRKLPEPAWFAFNIVAAESGVLHLTPEARIEWGSYMCKNLKGLLRHGVEGQSPTPSPDWQSRPCQTTSEACRILGVTKRAIYNYIKIRLLKRTRNKRITTASIIKLLKNSPPGSKFIRS